MARGRQMMDRKRARIQAIRAAVVRSCTKMQQKRARMLQDGIEERTVQRSRLERVGNEPGQLAAL